MSKLNYEIITSLVGKGSKIIDMGCGDGELFKKLVDEKSVTGVGIELNQEKAIEAISKELSVIQADLDEGLGQFPDKSFDFAILSQTLQSTEKPDYVIDEMLRVGKKAIVSFPNFAYWKVRFYLMFKGKMPMSEALPYDWYNTPNIHLMTIKDFYDFCKSRNIKIQKSIFLTHGRENKNFWTRAVSGLFSEEAIFIISR